MKKQFYSLMILVILVSCASNKNTKYRKVLVSDYKKVYFRKCLYHGFNKSQAVTEILTMDNSIHSEYIHMQKDYKIIDSLARITAQEIKKDSMEMYQTDDRGKPVLYGCLKGYTGKWLDSIARNTYKVKK